MRRNCLLVILVTLVAALTIIGCSSANPTGDAGGKNISLNFATFWPSGDFQVTEGHEAWAAELKARVEAETDHRLNINFQTGGVLLGATEIYEGVASGVADIGSTSPSYTAGIFRATTALELPGFNNDNALVASMTIQEAYETIEAIQNEYSDVKVMHFWATGPGDIITTSPVTTLEDLRGMEIRVAGRSPAMEALGAEPVSLPMSESYLSLDQGIVRGILGPTDILQGFRLAEVTSHIVKTPYLYNITFVKVMNLDTWNSLPSDVQEIFNEVNAKYVYEYGVLRSNYTKQGQQFAIEEFGHEVITLSSAEEARWLDAISGVQDNWVADMSRNGLPAQEIIEKVRDIDQKQSTEYGNYFQ
ncbi:TRAP transporter substrate-binding protein [Desulfuribacillus alkaliarsenatis]|uniref:ABC transporter substrate-binding protein n=1 Tax=Desulfuribacillus alkaliarsenatis TaxID=766136 RepID=A0A1E5G4Y5_9FIRM|nr:TRAP transporter substrate-binding protein [Desulfuribacillus alkaliarsenatis]OEF98241.1 hypothetical protein BHF68_00720 [Desulfuribacillus alkaliarsenatis]